MKQMTVIVNVPDDWTIETLEAFLKDVLDVTPTVGPGPVSVEEIHPESLVSPEDPGGEPE